MKTNHHHLVPRLMMSDTIPLLPYIPSWCEQEELCLLRLMCCLLFVNFWCRWEEEKKEDGTKWNFLEHKGPVFAPPYERLPPDVKFFYDGLCFLHYSSTTFRLPCYCIIKHNWHAGCLLMYNIKFWEELPQCLLSFRCLCSEASGIYLVRIRYSSSSSSNGARTLGGFWPALRFYSTILCHYISPSNFLLSSSLGLPPLDPTISILAYPLV